MSMALAVPALSLSYTDWPATSDELPWLVLLHGWGVDSRVWEVCRPWQQHFRVRTVDLPGFGLSRACPWPADTQDLLDQLQAVLPPGPCSVLGWSMGGQLATLLAAQCPERIERLVLVASNPHFLAEAGWPGMDASTTDAFHQLMMQKGAAGLTRFAMLVARGDLRERQVMETLRTSQRQAPDEQALLESLAVLETLDTRAVLAGLPMPVLHVLGEADQLVPVALAKILRQQYPGHAVIVLPAFAHAPFVSDPQAIFNAVQAQAGKLAIAQRFSKASAGYDAVAGVQQRVIAALLDSLPVLHGRVLDVGCGTGLLSRRLQQRGLQVIGCDIADGMLQQARRHGIEAVFGDAESLPFANVEFDAVVSASVLQWCEAPRVLAEAWRVLKPGGYFAFATFGEHTLCELKAAFALLDEEQHINAFASLADWHAWTTGWALAQFRQENLQQRYGSVMALLHELKAIGANHRHARRSPGLKGRRYWQALDTAYAARTPEGDCTATWDVIIGVLEKPV